MEGIQPATPLRLLKEVLNLLPNHLKTFIAGAGMDQMTHEELMSLLVEGYSLYRWGDGETAIARGKSISYQESNIFLARKIRSLLGMREDRLVHGLSWACTTPIWDKRWKNKKLFKVMFSTRVFLIQNHEFSSANKYVETQIWYHRYQNLDSDLLKIVRNRPVLLVASDEKFLSVTPSQTQFLKCLKKNAFIEYESLHEDISKWISKQDKGLKPCILLAAGPTSKAIIFDFMKQAQLIDIGHGFDFFLRGSGSYAWKE